MKQFYAIYLQLQILIRWMENTIFHDYGYIRVQQDHPRDSQWE